MKNLLFLLIVLLCGKNMFSQQAATKNDSVPTVTKFVVVNNHKMRIRMAGFDKRVAGTPVVVLEAGMGDKLETWDSVFSKIAKFAPVVAYDRMGLGSSEGIATLPFPESTVRTLHALLRQASVSPPYILVGHSWGGPVSRMFAAFYPSEVQGLVFIDATNWDMSQNDRRTAWLAAGHTEADFQKMIDSVPPLPSEMPAGQRAELELFMEVQRTNTFWKTFSSLPAMPKIPVAVLNSGKPRKPRNIPPPKQKATDSLISLKNQEHRLKWVRSSSAGLLLYTTTAGHYIHKDEPGLVIQAIRYVLDKIQIKND